jgi:hypothetical protein
MKLILMVEQQNIDTGATRREVVQVVRWANAPPTFKLPGNSLSGQPAAHTFRKIKEDYGYSTAYYLAEETKFIGTRRN